MRSVYFSKRIFIISLILICTIKCYNQTSINIDSLLHKMCKTLNSERLDSDSATITNMFVKHLSNYTSKLNNDELDSLYSKCFFRLQIKCVEFRAMLDKINPGKGHWVTVTEMPESKITDSDCSEFFLLQKLRYLEYDGDTTHVSVTANTWTDHFPDRTFSNLSLKRIGNCEFELTFNESNNITRKNLSNKGDVYYYKLLEKHKEYYVVLCKVKGSKEMSVFKIYY